MQCASSLKDNFSGNLGEEKVLELHQNCNILVCNVLICNIQNTEEEELLEDKVLFYVYNRLIMIILQYYALLLEFKFSVSCSLAFFYPNHGAHPLKIIIFWCALNQYIYGTYYSILIYIFGLLFLKGNVFCCLKLQFLLLRFNKI